MAGRDSDDGLVGLPDLSLVSVNREPPAPLSMPDLFLKQVRAAQARGAADRDRRATSRDLIRASAYLRVADKDEVTGALQFEPGMVELRRVVNRAHLQGGRLVVVFLDVDRLQQVNDTADLAADDDVLRTVGRALAGALRAGDLAMRYGGSAFLCALPDAELPNAQQRVLDVSRVLAAPLPRATVSIGLVQLWRDESLEDVVGRAHAAMYHAKSERLTPRDRD